MSSERRERVSRIETLRLRKDAGVWTYAHNHRQVIDEHWQRALKSYPGFFNGTIHVLTALKQEGTHVDAACIATEFKNFLYWRDEGFPEEARVRDGFGSALIRSAEGYIVLGRQRRGNINEGLVYLPGGFIDERDVAADGSIGIRGSVAREVLEETGLGGDVLEAQPGYLMCEASAHVSFAVVYQSPLKAAEIVERVRTHIAKDPGSELTETVVIRSAADTSGLAMPHYARVLVSSPLAWDAMS